MKAIKDLYRLKSDDIVAPKTFLGALDKPIIPPWDRKKMQWTVSAEPYIKNTIKNIEEPFARDGL